MIAYTIRRILYIIPTLLIISMISFAIIELPPGDYLTAYMANLSAQGTEASQDQIAAMRQLYGLDQPIYIRYVKWLWRLLHGDMGISFEWNRPVSDLIWERLALTFAVSLFTVLFIWVTALPIGIYSAVKQYSPGDYIFTAISFIGLGIPNFMIALVLLWLAFDYWGVALTGLFSREFVDAPWSWAKFVDMLKHMWVPIIVLGTGGTAGLVRTMRANLLDELRKPYVVAARANGVSELKLLFKYPVRIAINPFISTIGWILPQLVSGATIVSVVLSLPTTGPLLLNALLNQDMYLAGSFIMMLSVLTVIGTLLSDLLLAVVDPRIRFERENA
ncbi:ABC transporter permease [Litorilinea aerophila]|uniref:ABC transporter permease n=1 Tax=Litorilinea aerophila TaxID=1204385 RepID=A0A540VGK9_9CHLR|nr:ABC transporter permease [Litorilinea aerophila]MCC9077008.1 ABC transporter permease [Litorilinea aerophila]OUC08774.1 ABC transporter permease [Litorilinea aerophila]